MSTRTATRPSGTAGGGLRRSAKRVLRGVGVATSWARPLPDFVVIGAKRAGTTSLYAYLAEHPDVAPLFPARQRIKGVHYFDTNHHRGLRWYRSHMPSWIRRTGGRLAGEASPYYLAHPLAAERAARTIPDAKLVVLLRNPADRAYSHYRERVRHDAE
ncbi:MAG: sulfotransferase domain-containing protein, partial [Actinomycetota bacterium]|nr:sulfotransferase domain-containing protein [Actinomycetota bacterium]